MLRSDICPTVFHLVTGKWKGLMKVPKLNMSEQPMVLEFESCGAAAWPPNTIQYYQAISHHLVLLLLLLLIATEIVHLVLCAIQLIHVHYTNTY